MVTSTMRTNWHQLGLTLSISAALTAVAFGQTKVGDVAPDFSVTSMSGKQLFFKDMHSGGPTFIYFLRDGDSVCQQATGYIDKIISSYGTTRSTWYGILNAKEDRARSFQAEFNPPFRLTRDSGLVASRAFGVSSGPAVIQFDSKGVVVNVWKGFSSANLKSINEAAASANHKKVRWIDLSKAPDTAQYGVDYETTTIR
jgi:peroxiredoxin